MMSFLTYFMLSSLSLCVSFLPFLSDSLSTLYRSLFLYLTKIDVLITKYLSVLLSFYDVVNIKETICLQKINKTI